MKKIRVVVLASGRGSDFESIAKAARKGGIAADITCMITDNPQAGALQKAMDFGVSSKVIDYGKFQNRAEYEKVLLKAIDSFGPDLVVLAGYMRIVRSPELLSRYAGRIINIHPSLLPKYPGAHGQQDAFDAKEKESGYTIHFVDASLDGGPIIVQEKVDVSGCKNGDEVAAKILAREHIGLPKVVGMFATGKFEINGKKVTYTQNR
ncbi:MAG: phosphoribosylglycinamide formyltransferase [Candidatus Micrarchaeia archaeon]|jgi:phosphoribosylglycinamide formyltransferase-1